MTRLTSGVLTAALVAGGLTCSGAAAPAAKAARIVTLPAGTRLPIVLDTTVGSDISRIEQPVRAHLSRAVMIGGEPALAPGSVVTGYVTSARRSGRVKGRAYIAVRFTSIAPRDLDTRYNINAASIARVAPGTKKRDAFGIAGSTAGGAIIGALVGGEKGAAVGSAVGGGAGTAVVLSTRGKEVRLPRGAALTLRLRAPLTVNVAPR